MADSSFWVVAGLISFAVGALFLRSMARGAGLGGQDAMQKALALYRDQLAEVDRDVVRGVLSEAEAAPLRTEVQRRMLEASRRAPAQAAPQVQMGTTMAGFAAVCAALVGAFALYLNIGAPAYRDLPLSQRLAMAQSAYDSRPSQAEIESAMPPSLPSPPDPEFAALMDQLRATVAARPNDVQGLTLLARNEASLGNFTAAARAYDALIAAKGDAAGAEDHLGAAQAMIAAAGGQVSPQAEAALMQTLRLDAENGMARYFLGLMFAQTGRPDRAFALWEPLSRTSPEGAPWTAPIAQLLPDVAAAAGIRYTPPRAMAQLAGPSAADVEAAQSLSTQDRAVMINTMVTGLEERLLSQGGSAEEWQRLVTSLATLGEVGRARTALAAGSAALAGDPAALAAFQDAASAAGIAP